MLDQWLQIDEDRRDVRKTLFRLNEKAGGRAAVADRLVERVRSHYGDLDDIADDVKRLGFPGASELLRERLPRETRAQSGEMGEILATEFVEFQTGFRIPVRRLRYKDHREQPMRGDDFLGIRQDEEEGLSFLKGEAKSGQAIQNAVVAEARGRLSEDDGRPTPISLLFVTDYLLHGDDDDKQLGKKIRDAFVQKAVPPRRITQGLFTLSGNVPQAALENDLDAADDVHIHISANFHIQDHQAFIAAMYRQVGTLGDD